MIPFERGLRDAPREKLLHVLKLKPGMRYAIKTHPDPDQWIRIRTHYCSQAEGRVVCIGEECRCRGRGIGWAFDERIYVPVAYVHPMVCDGTAMLPSDAIVNFGVFCFTEGASDTLYETKGRGTFYVYRRGKENNGPVQVEQLLWDLGDVKFKASYPVIETLERLFGARR